MRTKLSGKKKRGIVDNLLEYNCRRAIIHTTVKNETVLSDLGHDISILKIGYQILTEKYHRLLACLGWTMNRKMDSEEVRQDVKAKIADFLLSLDLDPQITDRNFSGDDACG